MRGDWEKEQERAQAEFLRAIAHRVWDHAETEDAGHHGTYVRWWNATAEGEPVTHKWTALVYREEQ